MRIRLKGLNSITKKLANGTRRTYWYAWKSGPPLRGEPGTPEFIASYNEAATRKTAAPQGVLLSVLQSYQVSGDFLGLAPRTRADYIKHIKAIEKEYGNFPLSGLTDRRARGMFMAWRDKLALRSRRQADYTWQVLALILAWGLDRGLILANPCARWWPTVPRQSRRQDLDGGRPGSISQIGSRTFASAGLAGAVDRPTARRSVAAFLVCL
jgi:hypothetical protein